MFFVEFKRYIIYLGLLLYNPTVSTIFKNQRVVDAMPGTYQSSAANYKVSVCY